MFITVCITALCRTSRIRQINDRDKRWLAETQETHSATLGLVIGVLLYHSSSDFKVQSILHNYCMDLCTQFPLKCQHLGPKRHVILWNVKKLYELIFNLYWLQKTLIGQNERNNLMMCHQTQWKIGSREIKAKLCTYGMYNKQC